MRKFIVILIIASLISGELFAIKSQSKKIFRVATFNIRLQTSADTAARSWDKRKTDVARIIKQYDFDVFGVQEVGNLKQEADLKTLIPNYTYFGKGRDNQQGAAGEQIGVFFKTKRYLLSENGSFFLSETPEKMSKGWDADYRRMCVWTKLFDRKTKTSFYVFCTHFDHIGVKARAESARLIVAKIKQIAGNFPVLLVGDLNATTNESVMYEALSSNMQDSREIAVLKSDHFSGTFNGYEMSTDSMTTFKKIDYIFCKKIKVLTYKVLTDRYSEGSYPSDHFSVMIECEHL
jgi:endonuclease/exonuclease/phosphatase family metal-dependent hydrolase